MIAERKNSQQEQIKLQQTVDLAKEYWIRGGRKDNNNLGDWYAAENELKERQKARDRMFPNESAITINDQEFLRKWEKIEPTHEEVLKASHLDWIGTGKTHGHDVPDYYNAQNRLRRELRAQLEQERKDASRVHNGSAATADDKAASQEAAPKPAATVEAKKDGEAKAESPTKQESTGSLILSPEEAEAAKKRVTKTETVYYFDEKGLTTPDKNGGDAKPENSPKERKEELRKEFDSLEKRAQEIALELQDLERAESANKNATAKPEAGKPETHQTAPKADAAPKPKTIEELEQELAGFAKGAQEHINDLARQIDQMKKGKVSPKEEPENKDVKPAPKPEDDEAEKLKKKAADKKAQCDKLLADARAEGEKKGKEEGIKEGKDELWKKLNDKMSWKEKAKNFFKSFFRRHPKEPKTDEEKINKYKGDIYRTIVLAGVGGAITTLLGVGVAQYFGFPLPIPINNPNSLTVNYPIK